MNLNAYFPSVIQLFAYLAWQWKYQRFEWLGVMQIIRQILRQSTRALYN